MRLCIQRPREARAFLSRQEGVAAVEFAMVLPFLVILYFGLFELTQAIDFSRKTTLFARSVADLTGQAPGKPVGTLSAQDMSDIFAGATAIFSPFDANDIQVVVNALGVNLIDGSLVGRVCSSYAHNASPRPPLQVAGTNGLPDIPATQNFDGGRYLLVEVKAAYAPLIGSRLYTFIFGRPGLTVTRQTPWAARNGEVALPPKLSPCPKT
ncbi:MAG: pilus assembly protein [Bosea sp.]|nr:pilus assembly protein [Bosea sp. (in: a-proteobacteria)]MCP4739771.1 pilus assembly protein [Bosea sp. (in: a-proteobacteria)]